MRLMDKNDFLDLFYVASAGQDKWFIKAVEMVVEDTPTIDAVPVTAAELKHLINDTIAYIWDLEDRGADKPEFGYDSRKALLEKLKQFEREHFPEMECCCGERKDGEG